MGTRYIHSEEIHNFNAPNEVVPLIMSLLNPQSVLDVGCGIGTWLKIFEDKGIGDYMGIDGDYVDRSLLKISSVNFKAYDLTKEWSLNRKYDLVISLEVAEHLPENSADLFVRSLVNHTDVILFSAAIPGQGGQNHVNEQWPEYWESKFEKYGYYFHDTIRPLIWKNENVEWWYRQNIFLITKQKPSQRSLFALSIVHPCLLSQRIDDQYQYQRSLQEGKQGLRLATVIFVRAIIFKFKSIFEK